MTGRLFHSESAATLAEFALVLPILLLFSFGLIDGGRMMWEVNRLEKAVQVGARMAVVTNALPPGLVSYNFVGKTVGGTTLTQGDRIPADTWVITCTDDGCTCTVATCPAVGTMVQADFRRIVDRMKVIEPRLAYGQVAVDYRSAGLGFAGDPNGMDISPAITVRLRDDLASADRLKFVPLTAYSLVEFNLPSVDATLTGEDLNGTVSN